MEIATYWDDLGNQLGVKHLDIIKTTSNPTKHRFKEMLKEWLSRQDCSEDDIFKMFHQALIDIELIRAAGDFNKKLIKGSDRDDDDNVDFDEESWAFDMN